jgi:hypothetical protein
LRAELGHARSYPTQSRMQLCDPSKAKLTLALRARAEAVRVASKMSAGIPQMILNGARSPIGRGGRSGAAKITSPCTPAAALSDGSALSSAEIL